MSVRGTRAAVSVSVTAAVLAGAAACSNPDADGASGASGGAGTAVVVGVASEPDTLSPLLGYGKDGNSKIFDGLLARNADLELRPALARALPEVTDDGTTYTYRLRDDVAFSDGEPFTAADVVFTYETILDPGTNNASKGDLAAVESVEADGDDTVVFHLKYPYAPFAERTVLPIAPEHVAGKGDVNTGAFNTEPVGTGPYVLDSWRKGEKLTFSANPDYWGGEPKVKKLTMAIIADDDIRATRLRSGDLDGAILPPNLAETFAEDDDKQTLAATSADHRAVTLPTGNPVTGDVAIRRALDVAVDRDTMVDKLLEGRGKAAYGPVPTDSEWFAAGTERPYDPEQAERILDDAGWRVGDDAIREKDGQRASFTLYYPSGDKLRQEHALAFAGDAKKVGIEARVESGTWEVIEPRMAEDAVLAGGGNPADPDFDLYPMLYSELAGQGFNNMASYTNPDVDAALVEGRESGEKTERKGAYDRVQQELKDNPGYIFLTHIDHIYVLADTWRGLTTQSEPHEHGFGSGPWWNVESWQPAP